MAEHSAKIGKYLGIFAALMVLTVVTVAVSKFHLGIAAALVVALLVASVKGGLVAGYFMHLIGENRWIYVSLFFTALFFVVLIVAPTLVGSTDYSVTDFGR